MKSLRLRTNSAAGSGDACYAVVSVIPTATGKRHGTIGFSFKRAVEGSLGKCSITFRQHYEAR